MATVSELITHLPEEPKKPVNPVRRAVWTVAEAIAHLQHYPMDDLVVSMVVVPKKKEQVDAG